MVAVYFYPPSRFAEKDYCSIINLKVSLETKQNKMAITRRKALYLFLSSLLGMLLLLMFHRAVFVIYDILGSFYPNCSWFNWSLPTIFTLDFLTMLVAMFIGGWYGVWLGLNWYHMIYEERGVTTWFHGFVPHRWRKSAGVVKDDAEAFLEAVLSKNKTAPKKIIVREAVTTRPRIESFQTFRTAKPEPSPAWILDELEGSAKPARKRVVKKVVAKKTTKRTSAKKKTTTAEE